MLRKYIIVLRLKFALRWKGPKKKMVYSFAAKMIKMIITRRDMIRMKEECIRN